MRQLRTSGSVEGVMGNHDSYSDSPSAERPLMEKMFHRRSNTG